MMQHMMEAKASDTHTYKSFTDSLMCVHTFALPSKFEIFSGYIPLACTYVCNQGNY